MTVIKNRYNEDVPWYESREEEIAAIRAYLNGEYYKLTILEIEQMKSCEEDPDDVRFDRDHAGIFSCEVDPLDFRGLVFIHDLGHTFEEGCQLLLDLVGPHPITPLTIWQLNKELNNEPHI